FLYCLAPACRANYRKRSAGAATTIQLPVDDGSQTDSGCWTRTGAGRIDNNAYFSVAGFTDAIRGEQIDLVWTSRELDIHIEHGRIGTLLEYDIPFHQFQRLECRS